MGKGYQFDSDECMGVSGRGTKKREANNSLPEHIVEIVI